MKSVACTDIQPARRVAAVVAACAPVGLFYAVLVTRRIEQHSILWFVHLGRQFLTAATTSRTITPALGWQSPIGYDGQYYFAVAVDPAHAHDYIGGNSAIVYGRVLYPLAAGIAGGGSERGVPVAMLAINLASVMVGTAALALWLQRKGGPAWAAAVFGLYPGLVFTICRDLTEPLAFGLTAVAVLVFDAHDARRRRWSALVFALALLARETVAPFALAAAVAVVAADRTRTGVRRGALFAVGAFAPVLVWRVFTAAYLGESSVERGGSSWAIPFHGLAAYRPFDAQHRLILLTIVLPSLVAALAALPLLRRPEARIPAALLLVNVLVFVVFLPEGVYVDYGAAGRATIGVVVALLYCLPFWRLSARFTLRLATVGAACFALTIPWYLLIANLNGLDGMNLIST